jgi:DNA-binding response OmpR family regulator
MNAKILIVEDEFLVALELEDILLGAGHTVVGIAPDRASVGKIPDAPQVALIDLNLRDGPSGTDIAQDLSRAYGTVIIYVTANPSQIVTPAPTAIGVVQKPFSQHAVLAAIAVATGVPGVTLPRDVDLYPRAANDYR